LPFPALEIDLSAAPMSVSGDSAVYNHFGNLQLTLGNTTFTDRRAAVRLGNGVQVEYSFTPDVIAEFALPQGTLNGTGSQSFSASLSYAFAGGTQDVIGTSAGDRRQNQATPAIMIE
jgi:hypothetical protein